MEPEQSQQSSKNVKAASRQQVPARRSGRRRILLSRFARNKTGVAGLIILALLVLLALFGPWLSPWSYDQVDRQSYLKPPSVDHPLGTTQSGRDMWALTLHGLRKSLIIGFVVAVLSTAIAAIVGSFAAYYGGWLERFTYIAQHCLVTDH